MSAAAAQLDHALSTYDDVVAHGIPHLFGRRAATEQASSMLGDVADRARSAADALADHHVDALDRARRVAGQLATEAAQLRGGPARQLRDVRARPVQAVDDARDAVRMLRQVAAGLAIDDAGAYRANVQRLFGDPGHDRSTLEAASVLADARPDLLGTLAPFAEAAGVRDLSERRLTSLVGSSEPEVEQLWSAFVDLTRDLRQPVERMRRAFEVIAAHRFPDAPPAPPRWLLDAEPEAAMVLERAQRIELQLRASARSAGELRTFLYDQLAVPDRSIDALRVDLVRLAPELLPEYGIDILSPATRELLASTAERATWQADEVHRAIRADWVASLAAHPADLQRQVDRLGAGAQDRTTVQLVSMLAARDPATRVGARAAARPWISELFPAPDAVPVDDASASSLARAWDVVRDTGGDRDALVRLVADIVSTPAAERTSDQFATLRAIMQLPDDALPDALADARPLVTTYLGTSTSARDWRSNEGGVERTVEALRLIVDGHAAATTGAITREAATHELDDLLAAAAAGSLTTAQGARLRWLDALPRDVRPVMSAGTRRPFLRAYVRGVPESTDLAIARSMRAAARDVVTSPDPHGEALRELSRLLDRPDSEFTVDDVRRIYALAGLPSPSSPFVGEVRALDVDAGLGYAARFDAPTVDPTGKADMTFDVAQDLGRLRIAVHRSRIADAPETTPELVRDQLAKLVSIPPESRTAQDIRLLAALDGLPAPLRFDPIAPLRVRPSSFYGMESPTGADVRSVVESMRRSLALVDVAERHGLSRADLVQEIDPAVLAPRADVDTPRWDRVVDGALLRLGVDPVELLAQAMDATRGSGSYDSIANATRRAQALVGSFEPTTPQESALVDSLRDLLDANAARVAGRRADGYATHPDYAVHGRAIAIVDTLRALRRIESRASDAAASSADGLVW